MMMAIKIKKKTCFFGLVWYTEIGWALWNWLIKIITFSFRFIIKIIVIIAFFFFVINRMRDLEIYIYIYIEFYNEIKL